MRQCPSRYAFRAGRNLPDKEFRYLRTVIVTAAVDWGFGAGLAPLPLTFQHRAGVSPYTASCDFAGTCVCGKQSLGPLPCPRPRVRPGPLLPKLRGEFAEFLNERSLARLRLLASPTCVGFGYGHPITPGTLFWVARLALFRTVFSVPLAGRPQPTGRRPGRTTSCSLHRDRLVTESPPCLHRLRRNGLALGPTNPERTILPPEPCGFRRARFSRAFSLLIPAFALHRGPRPVPRPLRPPADAPLPPGPRWDPSRRFGRPLSPEHSRRRATATSELLRTLSRMAASKPTSWLSQPRDDLCHSVVIEGP